MIKQSHPHLVDPPRVGSSPRCPATTFAVIGYNTHHCQCCQLAHRGGGDAHVRVPCLQMLKGLVKISFLMYFFFIQMQCISNQEQVSVLLQIYDLGRSFAKD